MKLINVIVHKFTVGDVEDPHIYAAEPLYKWENSEAGKWVKKHAQSDIMWQQHQDFSNYGYTFVVKTKLKEEDYTYFLLKYV